MVAKGIVINGLVILSERPIPWNAEHTNPPGGLEKYYRDNVIGGPGAFVMVAENFQSFGRAIIKKLIAEIASALSRHRDRALRARYLTAHGRRREQRQAADAVTPEWRAFPAASDFERFQTTATLESF